MWSPKRMTLLWFSGVCEGYPCPDCFLGFNKEFAVSGLGMVFKFQRFQLALGSVVEQLIDLGSTWILGDCLGGGSFFKLKLICGVVLGIFPRGKQLSMGANQNKEKACNY